MAETTFPLKSSWLSSASYDDETQTLTLTTQAGDEYTLDGVPPEVAAALQAAPSPGQFFARQLKGKY
jgi:hypothetical protein